MQDIAWFDLKYNWTGALVSRLAIDVSLTENVSNNYYTHIPPHTLHNWLIILCSWLDNTL